MVNARDIIEPPFTLYQLPDGEINITKGELLMKLDTRTRKCTVVEETDDERQRRSQTGTITKTFFGIFGQIELVDSTYLILIEDASVIGELLQQGSAVMRVEKLIYLPLTNSNLNRQVSENDKRFVKMLENLQKNRSFYFSYTIDLTKRIQTALQEMTDSSYDPKDLMAQYPTSMNYVHKFAFNHVLLKEYCQMEYAPFRVPVIYGFVSIQTVKSATFALVSRKDARRMGRRFITRGLDREGHAANFCETEHILLLKSSEQKYIIGSHVQIRGSIPLLWQMKPNMAWAPPVRAVGNFDESLQAAQLHMKETQNEYKQQYFVNLIDKKGSQDRIGKKMTQIYEALNDQNLDYVWFDFHGECKKMKWENLSKLVAIVKDKMLGYGYFYAELEVGFGTRNLINGQTCKILQTQTGAMRTNCMDCLDRTNVVQSVFSRQILHLQLHRMGLTGKPQGAPFEVFKLDSMEQLFRNAWTDNADILSLLYTGTPALKTDFTRTGKRSTQGAINDGRNSMTRYYINNFTDGYNHDCLDLSQGQLQAKQMAKKRGFFTPLKLAFISLIGVCILSRAFLDQYFPLPDMNVAESASSQTQSQQQYSIQVWLLRGMIQFGVFIVGMLGIQANGSLFVDDASRLNV